MTTTLTQGKTHLGKPLATALLGASLLLLGSACSPPTTEVAPPPEADTTLGESDADGAPVSIALTAAGREFFLDGAGDANPDILVQQGDRVEVTLCVTGGTHDWVVDEFDAATAQISTGDDCSTVEFVANQTGEFEYYCSVGSHRAEGMVGRFVVE